MKKELSVLIPVYNGICLDLVRELHRQAEAIGDLAYEIMAADDGSTDEASVQANRAIEALPHCLYIIRGVNAGRAAIRNFLAQQARYGWLLFLDCDMVIHRPDFLSRYLECMSEQVVYGGYSVGKGSKENLRYIYEKKAEPFHTAEMRQANPYHDFHTANFMIRRELMLSHPFDERFRYYGYEDVLFGKVLKKNGIAIVHIDNPAGFDTFESNPHFLSKTEEGLRTLHEFRHELRGYNRLLTLVDGIHVGLIRTVLRSIHRLIGPLERKLLCSRHPNLTVFKLYKLGYFLNLELKTKNQEL
jgi:glycosyltransferase involved in cell wall biosynthesis